MVMMNSINVSEVFCTRTGPDMAEKRAPAFQRGSGDAEDTPTSEHRSLLRLLRRASNAPKEGHCPRYRAHDLWHAENV